MGETTARRWGYPVTACAACGFDPDARVLASWTFTIEMPAASLNVRSTNKGGRRFAYKKARDQWHWWFRERRLALRIPVARRRRRVMLTRLYTGRQKELDRDNLIGGLKLVVDALVREELLAGDDSARAEIHYRQVPARSSGLTVLLEELA